ncbi:PKD domain-containing protein [Methanimicrococcus sp. OttesenSCG-928-J09]|nr:PKD domain-containing protein [Methanimicrococcus sp. OttesenSCG-928-J09]
MVTQNNLFKKIAGVALILCLLFSLTPAGAASGGYIEVGTIPVPDFTGTPLKGKAPLEVQFTDNSSGAQKSMKYLWDFGDGSTSTDKNPKHTYTKEGYFTVTLTLTNDYGTKNMSKKDYVYVGSGPIANFTADKTSSTSALNVRFTDQSTGAPTSWLWDFGDGTTSTEKNPSHSYSKLGSYNVSLTVSNSFGKDTMTKSSYININAAPYVFFTANTSGTRQIAFTSFANVTEPATYSWNFGDGTSSSEKNPTHTFKTAGKYTVSLTVGDKYSNYTYTIKNLSVPDPIKADFTAANNIGGSPLKVQFTDTSSGSNLSYHWNFGDGTTSNDKNPSHTYNTPGTYNVALTVIGGCGVDSIIKNGFVSVGKVPVAEFTGTPTSGSSPLAVQFTDNSKGENLKYSWDFGDGKTSTDKNPKHTYEKSGTYTVKLTVSNSYGNNTATKDKYITVGSVPRANFNADVLSGIAPHPVQFTDLSTGEPTSWSWDFGDGSTSTEKNPKHTYQKSGYYNVTLTVKNAYGQSTLYRMGDGQEVWAEDANKTTEKAPEEVKTNEPAEEPQPTEEKKKTAIPGFGLTLAIAAVFCLAGIGAYKKRK